MHRLPVLHDDQSFHDRTERMFREMEEKMGFHSLNDPSWSVSSAGWPSTAHKPSFFELRPSASTLSSHSQLTGHQRLGNSAVMDPFEILDDDTTRSLFVDLDRGQSRGQGQVQERENGDGRLFRMSFDMRQYDPSDISVRSENDCLVVEAKHSDDQPTGTHSASSAAAAASKVSRQFSRRIQLPAGVDPQMLTSTLSADNILTVEAPVPPVYDSVISSAPARSSRASLQVSPPMTTIGGRLSPRQPQATLPLRSAALDTPTFAVDPSTGRRRLDLAIEFGPPYVADDIAVRLEGRRLTIDAKHENRDESRGRCSTSSTQRQFDLGEDIDPATIRASVMKADSEGRVGLHLTPRENADRVCQEQQKSPKKSTKGMLM